MSRVGKEPVAIPEKVDVKINEGHVTVKGPKGQLEYQFTKYVTIELVDKTVVIKPINQEKLSRALWGTTRSLINNMVTGVTQGFNKSLELNGVGYKAVTKGSTLVLNLGYSHPIEYKLPDGVSAKVDKNIINISGNDKELVGFAASKVRSFRPPEPYKGKGVKYVDEVIIRKAGKSGAKK
ncbi:MAG: 50S ribosomal protein L6 [Bacteriovoracaceae bacterium]|nr:50S ribosomal protein L6 [Bacteriovoracaceae bacterium]